MFRYNPEANYQAKGGGGGRYLQIVSGKDLY